MSHQIKTGDFVQVKANSGISALPSGKVFRVNRVDGCGYVFLDGLDRTENGWSPERFNPVARDPDVTAEFLCWWFSQQRTIIMSDRGKQTFVFKAWPSQVARQMPGMPAWMRDQIAQQI